MTDHQTLDLIPVAIYLILLLWLGFRTRRKDNSRDEFLLGSRSLTVPAFVATLVTTWYGGILGVGEFIFKYGISAWVLFGLPYYLFAVVYALWMAPKIRSSLSVSIPDMLHQSYGKKAGIAGSLFLIVMTSPAPYILMLGTLLQLLFDFGFHLSVILGTLVSIIYVFWGGFRSVVLTDKLQFLFMFAGFLLLFIFSIRELSPADMVTGLDDLHRSFTGKMSWQKITVWILIASWTFIDPGFHQRCAAARTPQTARKGILISVGFWFLFDMLTLSCGLYAFVLYPEIEPLYAYPHLAYNILPPILRGIFFTGLIAIIMSTIDSYTFLSAVSFGNDFISKIRNWNKNELRINYWIRVGLILTGLLAIGLIFLTPSVIALWYNLGSLFIPPLLIPLLTGFSTRFRPSGSGAFFMMLISFLTSLGWFVAGQVHGAAAYPFGLEPFFPGMAVSVTIYFLIRFTGNKAGDR